MVFVVVFVMVDSQSLVEAFVGEVGVKEGEEVEVMVEVEVEGCFVAKANLVVALAGELSGYLAGQPQVVLECVQGAGELVEQPQEVCDCVVAG